MIISGVANPVTTIKRVDIGAIERTLRRELKPEEWRGLMRLKAVNPGVYRAMVQELASNTSLAGFGGLFDKVKKAIKKVVKVVAPVAAPILAATIGGPVGAIIANAVSTSSSAPQTVTTPSGAALTYTPPPTVSSAVAPSASYTEAFVDRFKQHLPLILGATAAVFALAFAFKRR